MLGGGGRKRPSKDVLYKRADWFYSFPLVERPKHILLPFGKL
jgi:hypothetical protein